MDRLLQIKTFGKWKKRIKLGIKTGGLMHNRGHYHVGISTSIPTLPLTRNLSVIFVEKGAGR